MPLARIMRDALATCLRENSFASARFTPARFDGHDRALD